jgi:hypothetical protein
MKPELYCQLSASQRMLESLDQLLREAGKDDDVKDVVSRHLRRMRRIARMMQRDILEAARGDAALLQATDVTHVTQSESSFK